jgi:transposase
MVTIGTDVHLKTSTFSVVENGQRIAKKRLNNDPDDILKFVRQFPGPKRYAMEATYNWPVFHDLLKDEVDEFHLIHAKRMKAIVESQNKCDKRDADVIAQLTDINFIPKAYVASAQTRQYRDLLRTFIRLSRYIACLKNRVHAIINTHVFYSQRPRNFKDLFCKRGLRYLKDVPLPQQERFLIDRLVRQIQYMQKVKTSIHQRIESINFHSQDLRYLRTVPGLGGKVLVYVVLAEIDQIARFKNFRSLIAYAGLSPRDKSSSDKQRKGRLKTESNHFLQWAMIESSLGAILKDPCLREYYKKVKAGNNCSAAKVAVARKLLKIVFFVLKEQRPYYSMSNRG